MTEEKNKNHPVDGEQDLRSMPFFKAFLYYWKTSNQHATERVGFWMGLLLLFAPIFYFLLFFKPYTIRARVIWGMWLGFIIFVKISGLSEPVLDVEKELEEQLRVEYAQENPQGTEEDTFIQQNLKKALGKEPPKEMTLEEYVYRLEGGFLGVHLDRFEADGKHVTLWFNRHDGYFDSPEALALSGVSAAFSLFYGRDLNRVLIYMHHEETPVKMEIEQGDFNRFFGLSEAQMRELAENSDLFRESPVRNMTPEMQRDFLKTFSDYR